MITEVATTAEHVVNELPIPAPAIGLLAFTGLMGLLFVTYAFRSLGSRH
ncbi:hypothetical protein [Demequina pelophila]|nr:hypothetical protein [Demequina pelophila]